MATFDPLDYEEVFARYITRNGKRIYPKNKQFFHFYVSKNKVKKPKNSTQKNVEQIGLV